MQEIVLSVNGLVGVHVVISVEIQVYRREQEERLGQKVVADIVIVYTKEEHATEDAIEDGHGLVDVTVLIVGQEHVAT